MNHLPESILSAAQAQPEGSLLSARAFLHLASRAAVNQALTRLTAWKISRHWPTPVAARRSHALGSLAGSCSMSSSARLQTTSCSCGTRQLMTRGTRFESFDVPGFKNYPFGKCLLVGLTLSRKIPEREIWLASFFELADNFPNGKQDRQ